MSDLSAASWVVAVSDAELRQQCGSGAFTRGADYARRGYVRTLVAGSGGDVLLATVEGTESYQVVVRRRGNHFTSQCSCPMVSQCKHVVAVVLTARERLQAPATPPATLAPWERALAPLLSEGPAVDPTLPRLALEVSLTTGRRLSGGGEAPGRRVRLTALLEGKRGKWIRTGASWSELERPRSRPTVRPEHLAVAHELIRLFRTAGRGSHGYGAVDLYLDELGPGVWPALEQARAAGIELVAEQSGVDVELRSATASVALDVDTAADGALAVRTLVLEGEEPVIGSASVIGRPGHGVVVDQGTTWRLQPLAPAPHPVLAGLVDARRTLTVPAADAERFLAVFYPALRRVVPVTSRSGEVELPELVPPVLRLDIAHGAGHDATIGWGFRYTSPVGGAPVDVPLRGGDAQVARDVETEHRLVQAVLAEPLLAELPGLRVFGPSGWALASAPVLHGLEVARLTQELVPRLLDLGVVVTTTGDVANYREAQEAPVISVAVDDGDERDWFDLKVAVHIGDEEVPLADLLRALAAGDTELLLDSGTYFSLDRPELATLRQIVDEARDLVDPEREGLRLSVFQADLWAQLVEIGVVAQQSARWQGSVDALLAAADPQPARVPAMLDATLRPYQLDGFRWLAMLWDAGLGGVLADDMGLGKTLQTLAVVARAKEAGDLDAPVLVIAPTSVVSTWAAEAQRFTPGLRVVPVTETSRRRGSPLDEFVAEADIVVSSYALVRIDAEDYQRFRWRAAVLDEAQFVKNHRSKTYGAIRRLDTGSTYAITGTPLENSLMDLWSILSLTAPGLFPTPEKFSERYRKPIEAGEKGEHLALLRRRIRPFVLRRTKELVARDLPPKQEQVLQVPLAPAHRTIYDRHLQRERQRLLGLLDDMGKNRVAILAALTTLRQMSLDPALVDPAYAGKAASAKLDLLAEHLTELAAEGHRVLVFSQFTRFLTMARERLEAEGIGTVYLDGRTRDRGARIAQFREGDATAFLISLKAGGFGLTLTEADYVYVLDPWWNPAAEEQAIDRAHRIGQTKSVNVYRLVSADTIEEKVRDLQVRKRSLFDAVVDDEGALAGALDAADIRALLAD